MSRTRTIKGQYFVHSLTTIFHDQILAHLCRSTISSSKFPTKQSLKFREKVQQIYKETRLEPLLCCLNCELPHHASID